MLALTMALLMHTCGSPEAFQLLRIFTVLHPASSQKKRSKNSVKQLILTIHLVNEITGPSGCWDPLILLYVTLFMLSPCSCMPLSAALGVAK